MDRRFLELDTSLFDKIPAALFRIRVDGSKYILADANAAGHLLTGGKIADLFGRDAFDIWVTNGDRHIAENLRLAHENGNRHEETFWHTFVSDRKRRYINAHYVPLGKEEVLLCINDLTEEKVKSEQLTHMESRYRALFERSNTGFLEGIPDRFYDCNNEIASMFGYSKHEFLQLGLADIALDEDLPKLQQLLTRCRDHPFQVVHWQGAGKRKHGDIFWIRAEITGIVDREGGFGHYLAAVTEITEQKQAENALRHALMDTVKAVATTVEVHDAYTSGHMERVAEICATMGKALGMDADEVLGLRLGASIHDIGKIGIPSSILSKPAKLSDAEFDLIKEHPRLGVEIIKDIKFPWPICEMVEHHHERLDGSGYPHGLQGEEIIKEARILAVADIFEAVTTHRPYRPALPLEKALAIMTQNKDSGKLDPDYVDCLLGLVKQGKIAAG